MMLDALPAHSCEPLAMILFAADAGFWLSILFPLIMFIVWILNQAIGRAAQPPNPPRDLRRAGLPPQPPRPAQARVDEEIEAFLRRAAQQRGAAAARSPSPPAPQPTAPRTLVQRGERIAPLRPAEDAVQVEVVEESSEGTPEMHTMTVAEHVHRHLDTREFQQRASNITKVDQADEQLQQRLHQAFDHEVGTLAAKEQAQQTAAAASAAATAAKITAGGVFAMLKDPNSLRNAMILQEILRRPETGA